MDDLIARIQADQVKRGRVEEPIQINIFDSEKTIDRSSTGLNGQFLHSLLLINCLLRLKLISSDQIKLISLCKEHYKDNKMQLKLVREYAQDYSPDRAIWWYTRDCFLYRMLNKALRVQNIQLLYLLRFFIRHLQQQLAQSQCSSPVHVYRGQLMSNDELEGLRNSNGRLIAMNSFFSTSLNRQLALSFCQNSASANDLQRVLFVIDADPHVVKGKPFANIASFSEFAGEGEVLFMLGSIFRINEVQQSKDREYWTVRLTLSSDDDHDLKTIFEYMKNEWDGNDGEMNLVSFGGIVYRMGRLAEAEKFFHDLLNEQLLNNNDEVADCYHQLAHLAEGKSDYNASLYWHQKSFDVDSQRLPQDDLRLAKGYDCIGSVYREQNDFNQALESHHKALAIRLRVLGDDHPLIGHCYNNMGVAYYSLKQFREALKLFYKTLCIYEKSLPVDHQDIGLTHSNIGTNHYYLSEYKPALEHLTKALGIYRKCLPSQHYHRGLTLAHLSSIYQDMGDYQRALLNLKEAAMNYRGSVPPTHPDVVEIEARIRLISSRLEQQ